jgi:probable HAF family extracellular repeat protein
MLHNRIPLSALLVAALGAALGAPAAAQASITSIASGPANLRATGMSPNGRYIVGADNFDVWYYDHTTQSWTGTSGVGSGGATAKIANGPAISANFSNLTTGVGTEPSRWTAATGAWANLGNLGSISGLSTGTAYDISGDGAVVVGLAWVTPGQAHAFRWSAATGMVDLAPGSGVSSRANGVSNDGLTVVGWQSPGSTRRATRWQNGVQTFLGTLSTTNPQFGPSEAYAVNANGDVIVGESTGLTFRWTPSGGMVSLGGVAGYPICALLSVSDDGSTCVGIASNGPFDSRAIVWRPEYGPNVLLLSDVLLAEGVGDVANWTLRSAVDVSADGQVIAGWGIGTSGQTESFRVVLPRVPESYCTSSTSTNGCVATITSPNLPSASLQTPSVITVNNVEGQKSGLFFYSVAGRNNLTWAPGSTSFFCVKVPVQRAALQVSTGQTAQCNGTLTLDWNAFRSANPTAIGAPWSAGTKVQMQGWFRDPPAAKTTNLSDALELLHVL